MSSRRAAVGGGNSTGSLVFEVNPQGFREVMKAAGEIDKVLTRELRRSIRTSAKTVMQRMQDEVRSGSYKQNTGMRDQIARSLRVQIATTTRNTGVRIIQGGSALPENKRRMGKVWEAPSFRHPVFGTSKFVSQDGHPYFFKIAGEGRQEITDEVMKAMQRAAQAVGGRLA